MPQQWRYAEGVWIPKEENISNIEQFRMISILSVEYKTLFQIVINGISPEELLHRCFSAEGRSPRCSRMHRTHKCGKPTDQSGMRKEGRLGSVVAGPC